MKWLPTTTSIPLLWLIFVYLNLQYSITCANNNENNVNYMNIMDPKRAQSRICLETIVNLTQSCSNKNYVYSTTMGIGSGFASEFNFYLIKSMLFGVFSNRRLIYLISKRTWEYDCPEQLGWACYLSFGTCPDRIVEPKDMDFSTLYSPHLRLKQSGPAYFDRPQISEMQYTPDYYMNVINAMKTSVYEEEFTALFKQQQQQSGSNNTAICDIQTEDIHKNDLAGILSNVLFQFNNKTKQGIATINNRYSHLHNRPYAGFLLRLTDKIDEVPEVDWPYLFNMNTVANRFLEVLHNYTGTHPKTGNAIKDIFLASDNCTAAGEILNVLLPKGFRMFGSCFHSDGKRVYEDKVKKEWNPRGRDIPDRGDLMTNLVIADILMLRKASFFLGTLHSNMARITNYLRYPHYENTYTILPRLSDIESFNFFYR